VHSRTDRRRQKQYPSTRRRDAIMMLQKVFAAKQSVCWVHAVMKRAADRWRMTWHVYSISVTLERAEPADMFRVSCYVRVASFPRTLRCDSLRATWRVTANARQRVIVTNWFNSGEFIQLRLWSKVPNTTVSASSWTYIIYIQLYSFGYYLVNSTI